MTVSELNKLIGELRIEYYNVPSDTVVEFVQYIHGIYPYMIVDDCSTPIQLIHKLCEVYGEAYHNGYRHGSYDAIEIMENKQ
jgi:hypothetical protein